MHPAVGQFLLDNAGGAHGNGLNTVGKVLLRCFENFESDGTCASRCSCLLSKRFFYRSNVLYIFMVSSVETLLARRCLSQSIQTKWSFSISASDGFPIAKHPDLDPFFFLDPLPLLVEDFEPVK